MIDIIFLSFIFLTPGLIISGLFKVQNKPYLTSSFSVFFWSFSSTFISINYLINSTLGNIFVVFFFTYWIIKFFDYKNMLFNFLLLFLIEFINNYYGILHIVSTNTITLSAALENLEYSVSNINVPSVQIVFLKFFNQNYILATLPQFVGFSLLIGNTINLIKAKNLPSYFTIGLVPIFSIFCVLLEVMTIRSHFLSSQILCLILIETLIRKKLNINIYLFFVSLFIASRLENLYFYYPLLFLILTKYLNDNVKESDIKVWIKLAIATFLPILINYHSLVGGSDIRSNIAFSLFLIGILNSLLYLRHTKFLKFFTDKFNLFFVLGILLLGIYMFILYDFKAVHSWLFLLTHFLDTHQGWVLTTIYFILLLVYQLAFSEKKIEQTIYFCILLTFLLIIVSSPLHHNWYGGEQWSSGEIDGIAIYNFFDESQTRSFLQLFLSIVPIGISLLKPNKI